MRWPTVSQRGRTSDSQRSVMKDIMQKHRSSSSVSATFSHVVWVLLPLNVFVAEGSVVVLYSVHQLLSVPLCAQVINPPDRVNRWFFMLKWDVYNRFVQWRAFGEFKPHRRREKDEMNVFSPGSLSRLSALLCADEIQVVLIQSFKSSFIFIKCIIGYESTEWTSNYSLSRPSFRCSDPS